MIGRPARIAALLAAVSLAGCGLGAGRAPHGVSVLVTRDFGSQLLRSASAPRVAGQETVMALLMRNFEVSTRYGGGFVQSIDGLAGGQQGAKPVDWFYYVNGVEAHKGAAATNVHDGDEIWWDHHDWSQTQDVPAVVGSYPQPFLDGIEGKRLPVRVECAAVGGVACSAVLDSLRAAGVPGAVAALGSGGGPQSLRVLVGPWPKVGSDPALSPIERGPRASGVYATISHDGATLTLLDPDGNRVRTLTGVAGLIAAARKDEDAPVWVVTGTDAAGVELAARAFAAGPLHSRFAIAVVPGQVLALPQVTR